MGRLLGTTVVAPRGVKSGGRWCSVLIWISHTRLYLGPRASAHPRYPWPGDTPANPPKTGQESRLGPRQCAGNGRTNDDSPAIAADVMLVAPTPLPSPHVAMACFWRCIRGFGPPQLRWLDCWPRLATCHRPRSACHHGLVTAGAPAPPGARGADGCHHPPIVL